MAQRKPATAKPPQCTWTIAQMEALNLAEALPNLRGWRESVERLLAADNIVTVGDLTRLSFEDFMKPELGFAGAEWNLRSFVLEFMIENGISFSDLNPAVTLPTETKSAKEAMGSRAANCLLRAGITRLELLPYVTAADLLDIRNFGEGCLRKVKKALIGSGVALRPYK